MIIRILHGKQVVCHHLYATCEIETGSEWIAQNGYIVKIQKIEDYHLIYYNDVNDFSKRFVKDSVSFQLKYSKII